MKRIDRVSPPSSTSFEPLMEKSASVGAKTHGRRAKGPTPTLTPTPTPTPAPVSARPGFLMLPLTLPLTVSFLVAFLGCNSMGSGNTSLNNPDLRISLSELDVVDCIVEGSVRQVGTGFVYQEPPRMARLTEFECASLGGTFVSFDSTTPNAVIDRWLPFAEGGDVSAQHRLGLLYEGVMGADPDYEKAAYWYGQAAKSGHRESMFALSILYEKGLGVEKDVLKSLNLYRQASGMEGDSLMLSSDAQAQVEALKGSLAGEIGALAAQRDALSQQVERLSQDLAAMGGQNQAQIDSLKSLVAQLNGQLGEKEIALAALPTFRTLTRKSGSAKTAFAFPALPSAILRERTMGKFYALIIGNNFYESMESLQTPHNDASQIADLLTNRYGFSTQLLLDANEEEIKRAIHHLNQVAGERDNILIYFAGHGHMRESNQKPRLRGYWLPTNADADEDVNWVDNWWITNHLEAAVARRALVVADSCYGGVFSNDLPIGPVTQLPPLAEADLDKKLERKSRFVLASGGVEPVLDATGPTADHSVFASAFIEVLRESKGSMSVVELYGRVFDRMYDILNQMGLTQEPELKVIRAAGHQSEGDFFFVARE